MFTPSLPSSQGDGKPFRTCVLTKTADLLSGTRALPLITHWSPFDLLGGEGVILVILQGVCHLVLQILTPFSVQNIPFLHPFSDLTSKIHTHFQTWLKLMDVNANKTNKGIANFQRKLCLLVTSLSFLFIWSWKYKYVFTLSWFPWKSYPLSDQNGQNLPGVMDYIGMCPCEGNVFQAV